MLNLATHVAIFLHIEPTDMRKGVDGLSGIVRGQFGDDPLSGSLYLFINRRADRLKILQWDGSGFWIYYRILQRGTFEVPRGEEPRIRLDATQLAMLLGGVPLVGVKRRQRYRQAS